MLRYPKHKHHWVWAGYAYDGKDVYKCKTCHKEKSV